MAVSVTVSRGCYVVAVTPVGVCDGVARQPSVNDSVGPLACTDDVFVLGGGRKGRRVGAHLPNGV